MQAELHVKLNSVSSSSNIGEHEECGVKVEKSAMPESDSVVEVASYGGMKDTEKQPHSLNGESNCQTRALTEPATGAIDLIRNLNCCPERLDVDTQKVNVTPELELSLRRMQPSVVEWTGQQTLCHSKASAFSRYDSNKTLQSPFPISAGTFSVPQEGANSCNQQACNQFHAFCSSAPSKTQENLTTFVLAQSGLPEATFVPIPGGYGYLYPPVYYMQGLPPLWSQNSHHEDSPVPTSSSVLHSTSEVNNPEQAFYRSNESAHHSADGTVPLDDKRLETARATTHRAPSLGLSSDLTSNGIADTVSSMKEESPVVIGRPTESSVNDNHVLVYDGQQRKDSHSISQREAALIKFRLKRKNRCFEKKVRYQSRKKLADQRARVKGQFVRQLPTENLPLDVDDRA